MVWLLAACALAGDGSHYVSGYLVPLFGANSTDGFGVGLGGDLFERPRSQDYGYRFKLEASTWLTTSLAYVSEYGQVEWRLGDTELLFRIDWQIWQNLPYAGVGGRDVSNEWGDAELGNYTAGPYAMIAYARTVAPRWKGYAQLYAHPVEVEPGPGSLLAARDPLGAHGSAYGDVTLGATLDTTDRWPLPIRGLRGELDGRAGGSVVGARAYPLAGAHGEIIGWVPVLSDDWLVVGGRLVVERSTGERPIQEEGVTGGRWRDELGFEQVLSGYGRIRTRGDGLVAGEVEVRPHFFAAHGKGWTLDGYGSLFAEQAWLFDDADPGPPMPSLGFGPELLWQKASQIRPFVSYGWRSEELGGPRRPVPQFGLSVMDPL
jgi:hypothetical protein